VIDTRAIRFGGRETPDGFMFELSGDIVPLDFANTLDERPRGGRERLPDYRALIRWASQAGMLSEQQGANLDAASSENLGEAGKAHQEAIDLRELIFESAKAAAGRSPLADREVGRWNAWLERVQSSRRLAAGHQGLEWQDTSDFETLDSISLAVAKASIELFVNGDKRARIRLCAAADCDWVFLDNSRRMNRVWCDMTVCGNRAKATRHYRRKTGK
jgi:predicted RNA-binding Zn ribbon-like protein